MANTTLYLTQGDTDPSIQFPIKHPNGSVMDLTGATVYFILKKFGSNTILFKRACTVDSPVTSGVCHYDWQTNDLADAGNYLGELEVVTPAGKIQTIQDPISLFVRPQFI